MYVSVNVSMYNFCIFHSSIQQATRHWSRKESHGFHHKAGHFETRNSKGRKILIFENTERIKRSIRHLISFSFLLHVSESSVEGEIHPFPRLTSNIMVRDKADISISFSFFSHFFFFFRSVKKCIRRPLHVAILNLAWLIRVYRDGCRLDRDLETQIPPIQIDFHEFQVLLRLFEEFRRFVFSFSFYVFQ